MKDYKTIRAICEKGSRISQRAIDEFLIGYVAGYQNFEKKMNKHFLNYKHVTRDFQKATIDLLKSQYLAHRVFSNNGLIHKIINYPAVQRLPKEEKEYIAEQASVPWRYSFAEIKDEPAKDFFIMWDVFNEEEYLLFSPSMSSFNSKEGIILWSNLIGYNGHCWQSFGPIGSFKSFDMQDVFFFASEHHPEIESPIEVTDIIDRDPLPYMLLLSGANYPRTFNGEHEMIFNITEFDLESLDTAKLKSKFTTEYNNGVYHIIHKKIGEHPHFSEAYFDENEQIIIFQSLTDYGYRKLVQDFNTFGFNFNLEAAVHVHQQMIMVTKKILRQEIKMNEYQDLFSAETETDPKKDEMLGKMNAFIKIILPDLNEGTTPDLEAAARKAELDIKTARDIYKSVKENFKSIPGKPNKPIPKEVRSPGKKEKTTTEPGNIYNTIYQYAREIRQMEPWTKIYEVDYFGVRIPGTDRVYFISVMGARGEFFGLAAYKGYEGFFKFLELQEMQEQASPYTILEIPNLMLSFTDREDLKKEDLDAIKKSGESFRGKGNWPCLDDNVPGWMPAFPEDESLQDLPVLLEQILWVLSKAIIDPEFIYQGASSDEEVFVRTPMGPATKPTWKNLYENPDPEAMRLKYSIKYEQNNIAKVSKKKVVETVWQADYFMLPNPVKEKGKKGYFPYVLLIVDKKDGIVIGMEMLTPEPDLHSMHEYLPNVLLKKMGELEYRPECLEIRSDVLYSVSQKVLGEAWVRTELVDEMPFMDEAIESLLRSIN